MTDGRITDWASIWRRSAVDPDEIVDRWAEICRELPNVVVRNRYGVPLAVRLPDGTLGRFMRSSRSDECLRAAVATVLRVPVADVPDARLDERRAAGESSEEVSWSMLADVEDWCGRRKLEVIYHDTPPTHLKRWVGIVPFPGDFNNHCLVMRYGEILFDPAANLWHAADGHGATVMRFDPDQVAYGISFNRKRKGT